MLENQLSPFRPLLLWLISILILLGVVDGLSAVFLKFVLTSSAHFLVWNPDIDASKVWALAGGNWDDELGWPSPRDAVAPPRDRTGAKYNSDFSQSDYSCASAYGASFVWGTASPSPMVGSSNCRASLAAGSPITAYLATALTKHMFASSVLGRTRLR